MLSTTQRNVSNKNAASWKASCVSGQGHRSGSLGVDGRRYPIPRKQLLELVIRVSAMRSRTSASHACAVRCRELCRHNQCGDEGCTFCTASDLAKSHDFPPSAKPLNARSATLFVGPFRSSFRNDVKLSQRLSM